MLKKLEAEWPSMFLQTTWKLEDVFTYSELSLQSGESQTPPANLSTPCVPLPSNNSIPGILKTAMQLASVLVVIIQQCLYSMLMR